MSACYGCGTDTPNRQLSILAGNWYCFDCIDAARAEYDSPEAVALRERMDREAEGDWDRAADLLAAAGCTEQHVAAGEWMHLRGDVCDLLRTGRLIGLDAEAVSTLVSGLVRLYTLGDLDGLPEWLASRYVLSDPAKHNPEKPRPGTQLDMFATSVSRPAIYPRKRLGR